jgi:hypothetical protein
MKDSAQRRQEVTPASLWIVNRSLEQLESLQIDGPSSGPDASIVVWSMADFISWSGAVPGMPTLLGTPAGERLLDGANLIQAIRAAQRDRPVQCIVRVENPATMPPGAIPFSAEAAARAGTDRRAVSFERALETDEEARLSVVFPEPPSRVSPRTYGWERAPDAAEDWRGWYERLQRNRRDLAPIGAVNGRRPAWARSA